MIIQRSNSIRTLRAFGDHRLENDVLFDLHSSFPVKAQCSETSGRAIDRPHKIAAIAFCSYVENLEIV